MVRFVYQGGEEFDGESMPASVEVFGLRFIEGVPTDVLPGDFPGDREYRHAISKLKANIHFKIVDDSEGAVEVLVSQPKKRGRPAKVVTPEPEPVPFEDAAE